MSEVSASGIATLIGQPDLYTALRRLAAQAPDVTLAGVHAALSAGDAQAQETARRLGAVDQALLAAVMRAGRGQPPIPATPAIMAHLATATPAPIFLPRIGDSPTTPLPTKGERPDMPAFSDPAFDAWFADTGAAYGLGYYGEKRSVYASAQFADAASPERRTIHLGVDVFAAAGTAVHAPLAGTVHRVTYNADPLDYGHTLILRHDAGGTVFFTLYGHLAGTLPDLLHEGQAVAPGQTIAHLGDWHENGGWAAHLHFQIITSLLEQTDNFFGVGHESLWDVWQAISPDPQAILRLPPRVWDLP